MKGVYVDLWAVIFKYYAICENTNYKEILNYFEITDFIIAQKE